MINYRTEFPQGMLQQYFPEVSWTGQASTVDVELPGIKKYNFDIVFLDIK
jgi:hypothetical protein